MQAFCQTVTIAIHVRVHVNLLVHSNVCPPLPYRGVLITHVGASGSLYDSASCSDGCS